MSSSATPQARANVPSKSGSPRETARSLGAQIELEHFAKRNKLILYPTSAASGKPENRRAASRRCAEGFATNRASVRHGHVPNGRPATRSEEHTSELQSHHDLV